MKHLKCICILAILLSLSGNVITSRVKDLLYMPIDAAVACFRRSNGTHQFGCSSSRDGDVGAIHFVENEADVKWLETEATAGPYIVVMPFNDGTTMFNRDVLMRFKKLVSPKRKVNGVLLMRNTSLVQSRPPMYSPDDSCPNRYSAYNSCGEPWNPWGSSLLLEDWPFPMFYLEDQDDLQKIEDCYKKYNAHDRQSQSKRSLCALEMSSFMYSARDSETCLRRSSTYSNINRVGYCDPLGDKNIHWPLVPVKDSMKSVILVIAKLDADSMFVNLVPGAGSAVTGLVTLIATAAYLNSLNPVTDDVDVVFSLLNGEAFDYIGSSRMAFDLKSGSFNALGGKTLRLEQISAIIELGQLGEGQIYLHTSNHSSPVVSNLEKELNATLLKNSYPPTSIQSFLQINSSLPTVVIANHDHTFVNKYYNSFLDDAESLGYSSNSSDKKLSDSLARVATKLGEELFRIVNKGNNSLVTNSTFASNVIEGLLPCYLESAKCHFFQAAVPPGQKLYDHSPSLYVRVARFDNILTILTGNVLKLLTGEYYPALDASACAEKHLLWLSGFELKGVCINSTVNYSLAVSPAFEIEGYNMKSGLYSTWTESVWDYLGMRMFLKAPPVVEMYSFIVGFSVTFISVFVIYLVYSRADVLYSPTSVDL